MLTETARVLGVVQALETELAGFARPQAVHHAGKAIADLAVMLAAGGVCPADVLMLRVRPHAQSAPAASVEIRIPNRAGDEPACKPDSVIS